MCLARAFAKDVATMSHGIACNPLEQRGNVLYDMNGKPNARSRPKCLIYWCGRRDSHPIFLFGSDFV